MAEPAEKKATYEDLYAIPDNMTGEIVNGELIVTPRPSRRHIFAASRLDKRIGPPYEFGEGGGPGGWIILVEPEIGLGEHTMVPDLAGWKAGRFPKEEDRNSISVAPDWVCEIISAGSELYDRGDKMPIYAAHGVPHAWLINPAVTSLEVYKLQSGGWNLLGVFGGRKKVRVEPFQEVEIDLGDLWLEP